MKIKVKESLTLKLFLITTITFIIFITITFVVQDLFFGQVYLSKKKTDIVEQINTFKEEYVRLDKDVDILDALRIYEEKHNTMLTIVNSETQQSMAYRTGVLSVDKQRIKMFNDVIIDINNNSDLSKKIIENTTTTFIRDGIDYNIKNLICISKDKNKNIFIAITSMQPVDEAIEVVKSFYLYFYIGSIFIILVLSSVYSNMIAKPLLKINKVARKISKLEFGEKCDESRDDEIGSLAKTLNFLSESLNNALSSLKNANKNLKEDIEKERALEKMRKEFVASVSHELKTPISLVRGYAEGIKDGVFYGDEANYSIDVIIDEAEKMGVLVKDMLDLSQFEAGVFKLTKEELNICELVNIIIKKLSLVIDEKKIKINLIIEQENNIIGDAKKIEQVISNYITNAIRHSVEGGIIVIRIMKSESLQVKIEVENSGEVILESDIEKIWDMFFKIDKSRNRNSGGTGLGLAIVKNIVELHGGKCSAKNIENGVVFNFEI